MMNWDEEAHQQFLRIKHPNYYRDIMEQNRMTIDVECEVVSSTPLTQDERTGILPEKG
jgi:hypothetical protein